MNKEKLRFILQAGFEKAYIFREYAELNLIKDESNFNVTWDKF